VVSAAFAFARTLRGYVARSAVGLQIAVLIPLMAGATVADLPDLTAAWLLGSAVTAVTDALDAVAATVGDPAHRPGAVSRRHRALVQMTERALWTRPIVPRVGPRHPDDDPALLIVSETALTAAARLVASDRAPEPLPDVHAARVADLERLAELDPTAPTTPVLQRAHHESRLISIVAAAQLWLAAASCDRRLPEPDFGSVTDGAPGALLRASAHWRSVWFANAVRTGVGAAACVAIVRELGLQQGLWVILAALLCINGALSAPETGRSLLRMTSGAATGVLAAAGLLALAPGTSLTHRGLTIQVLATTATGYQVRVSGTFVP